MRRRIARRISLFPILPIPASGRAGRLNPMTLVEVMVAILLCGLVTGAALVSLTMCSRANRSAAHATAAICLCQERLEEIRAVSFTDVTEANFPLEEDLTLTHMESPSHVLLLCDRAVTIADESYGRIGAKRVVVQVSWTFQNEIRRERLETIVYDL